ncbi:ABC transporter permease [Patulibacter minatonensis]|uniref:ABC transporter permease n=1 Tax=Patulibacter minatonensis TaxID=298163 RepID=UPI0004B98B34|nr:ABC transporter permease [Patulibacter minatonensis]
MSSTKDRESVAPPTAWGGGDPSGALAAGTPAGRTGGSGGPSGRGRTGLRTDWALLPSELRWISPLALIVVWQLLSVTGVPPERILAAPSQVVSNAYDLIVHEDLLEAIWVSLRRALLGFLLGAAVAISAGLAVGFSRIADATIDPLMQMVRTIPLFGLVPIFIIWFGIDELPKLLLVALGVAIPLYLNLVGGLRSVDAELYDVADTLRLTPRERLRHVILLGALPGFLIGLRQALGFAWLALIVAEQVNASEGLGYVINNARDVSATDTVVVGLIAYAVLGLLTDAIVRRLERRALRWREEAAS